MAAGGRESFVGAFSGTIFGPFGVGEALGGKMLLGGITNGFESIVRQKLEGKGINFKTVLTDFGIGAGTAAVLSQAISDKQRGEVSDISSYMAAGGRESFVGAVSGAIFGPFGVGEALGGKMLLGGVTNGAESILRQILEGKGINFKTVLTDFGIGAGTAAAFHGAEKLIKKAAPFVKKAFNKISAEISENIRIAKIALNNMKKGPKPAVLGSNLGNGYEALGRFKKEVKKVKKVINGVSNPELSRIDYLRNKYGKLTSEQINNRINLRGAVNDEIERLYKSGITKKKLGPAVAGVLDPKTGKYYFGINNIEGDVPKELHPLIKERIDNMPPEIYSSYEKWTLGAGSHAEVYALNEALLANPTAKLEDFMVYVVRSGKKLKPRGLPMPRCPHCEYITNGASYFPEVLKYGD
ncbi:YwqJ-related putative deaminase [Clostridium sp. ZS2-4]|uniref:YwqJ-related putative deaminase n=1 Tax=Clostridium sp. ZS2-4 TaxID=2987703 RepID=UPI002DD68705|nr:YwqJ-related putative deaminase [Clostridium sp. ZS2-4]